MKTRLLNLDDEISVEVSKEIMQTLGLEIGQRLEVSLVRELITLEPI